MPQYQVLDILDGRHEGVAELVQRGREDCFEARGGEKAADGVVVAPGIDGMGTFCIVIRCRIGGRSRLI